MSNYLTELALLKEHFPRLYIALAHHVTHKTERLTFQDHLYLLDIYKDPSDQIFIIKSSQSGLSEWLICFTIFDAIEGRTILYVLPTVDLMRDFVKTRINISVAETNLYYKLSKYKAANTKLKDNDSTNSKSFGKGVIKYVGTHSENAFIGTPADTLAIDEWDRCNQDNLTLAPSRLSHSKHKRIIGISNPIYKGHGIDRKYDETDKKRWFKKCEHCGHWFDFDFFKHVVEEVEEKIYIVRDPNWEEGMEHIDMICDNPKCGKPVARFDSGEWVPEKPSIKKSGYRINKLFSSTETIFELVTRFNDSLLNDTKLRNFYNMDLGIAYTPQGAIVSRDLLDKCVRDFPMLSSSTDRCVAGIDVGAMINVSIGRVNDNNGIDLIGIYEVKDEEGVIQLLNDFNTKGHVVDALPESRLSRKIAKARPNGWTCYYNNPKETIKLNMKEQIVNVDRTVSLDYVKEYLSSGRLNLPRNAASIPNFYPQMMASTRVYDEDKKKVEWIDTSPDHYFHSTGYMITAYRILMAT